MTELNKKISKQFDDLFEVKDVIIDEEFGNVTATIGTHKNVDCGFIEDYSLI